MSGMYQWYVSVVIYALFWNTTALRKTEITQISVVYIRGVYYFFDACV